MRHDENIEGEQMSRSPLGYDWCRAAGFPAAKGKDRPDVFLRFVRLPARRLTRFKGRRSGGVLKSPHPKILRRLVLAYF